MARSTWNRFTERARRVVYFAQEEASLAGVIDVDMEHLLFGLLREDDNVAMRVLRRMGFTQEQVLREMELAIRRSDPVASEGMQLTPRAKRVIDVAYEEARNLSNEYIGTEHLLLGLIRENQPPVSWLPAWIHGDVGTVCRVLTRLGIDLTRTRREVIALQYGASLHASSQPLSTAAKEPPDGADGSLDSEDAASGDSPFSGADRTRSAVLQAGSALWRGRSLISLADATPEQIRIVLDHASIFKALAQRRHEIRFSRPKTVAVLIEDPSVRTITGFEIGMAQIGGDVNDITPTEMEQNGGAWAAEVAEELSQEGDVVAVWALGRKTLDELVAHGTVPVINMASDREDPIQALADLLAIGEAKGRLGNHLKVAYIGEGSAALHALLLACAKVGVNLSVACPPGYEPAAPYVTAARRIGTGDGGTGANIKVRTDPVAAVAEADVLYVDLWASMGPEGETAERQQIFAPYQVTAALLAHAGSDAVVLTRLPTYREEEIPVELRETYTSTIQDQTDNRLQVQKALVTLIVGL